MSALGQKRARDAVLVSLGLADFDPLGQKLQEDADPDRQDPTLPKIDSMQFVDIAGIELFENGDKAICGDIVPDNERGQSNQADAADGKRPKRVAVADLDVAGGRNCVARSGAGTRNTSPTSPLRD